MNENIISYLEMCSREGTSLQRGMNFRLQPNHSVILMSVRPNAPYQDRLEANGTVLIYEGHDAPKSASFPDPKLIDQPITYANGNLTQNGLFFEAARKVKLNNASAERVRVYEKLKTGIWTYNGLFHLVDAWIETNQARKVCKFKLITVADDETTHSKSFVEAPRRRIIPSNVKQTVWKRDGGRCCICQSTDELHFDHVLPFSKGGTSLVAENVQLLCARHNLSKSNKIE